MLSRVKKSIVLALAGLVLTGMVSLTGGCTVAIDGLGDLGDYIVHIVDGCDHCDYDEIEIEYDD